MAESTRSNSTVYIGNLDERVSERVLYDILIQAGRVVDLHIPRDKDTEKPKGFAFAEYESKEIADYAVKLFSGLVTLYKRTLKFGISGQDKNNYSPNQRKSSSFSSHTEISTQARFSETKVPASPDHSRHQSSGYRSSYNDTSDYSRRAFGSALDSVARPSRSGRHDYNPYR